MSRARRLPLTTVGTILLGLAVAGLGPGLASEVDHSQRDVFHTVMGAFAMHSAAYLAEYDIFSKEFSNR